MDWGQVLVDATKAGIGVSAAAYALAAVGLNIHFGYTGLLNFGHVGFMLVGAYGAATTLDAGGSLLLALLVGSAAAAALGLLLGVPTLRLRADYLAIVTIAAAEILRLLARTQTLEPITNGVLGIQGFARPFDDLNPFPRGSYGIGEVAFSSGKTWAIVVGWTLVALTSLLVLALSHSPWGRVLRAIREDEDAARSLGKNTVGYKLQSLVLGGVIGSLAGILLALDRSAVAPDTYLPVLTFFVYVVVISGGPGRVLGPIVGAVVFWFLYQGVDIALREAVRSDTITFIDSADIGAIQLSLVGLGLMLLMIYRPQGIFGSREEMLVGER